MEFFEFIKNNREVFVVPTSSAHRDIEFVSMEQFTNKGVTSNYVQLRLRNGKKIKVANLRESADEAYEKLKACESSNEEFLQEQ